MSNIIIKLAKDGREVSYSTDDGWLRVAGREHWCGSVLIPISSLAPKFRVNVPAGYHYIAGDVLLTDAEAATLERAIAEYHGALASEAARLERVERRRIAAMYAQAVQRADYPDESISLRLTADKALAAWREQYPDAAREERQQMLRDQAAHERHLASGALTYDADGSLSHEDQQHSHDKSIAKAEALEAQASEL